MDILMRLCSLPLFLVLGACGAAEDEQESFDFVGSWAYSDGFARCDSLMAIERMTADVQIRANGAGRLLFVAGPSCEIVLDIEGRVARAPFAQQCSFAFKDTRSLGSFDTFTLNARDHDHIDNAATGTTVLTILGDTEVACPSFRFDGVKLVRRAP